MCQRGVTQKTIKSLEACKARCAAVAACTYLAWDASSNKECVHYTGATCQRTELPDGSDNQLFKKTGLILIRCQAFALVAYIVYCIMYGMIVMYIRVGPFKKTMRCVHGLQSILGLSCRLYLAHLLAHSLTPQHHSSNQ